MQYPMIPLYNTTGAPVAYADEACRGIYDGQGSLVAWFEGEFLYTAAGRYLGWAEQGWVYDRHGRPALFAENAIGGPARPPISPRATTLPARISWAALPRPLPRRQPRPARRRRTAEWSPVSALTYFGQ
ncbi:hypothetical protein GCM10011378_28060 [Hymenobacter glacieicola]|uniref:4-fold beta flower domain-containing protein n=2 Tax=Hymenobacter glacieicola TaxID=1562124 RepID=A0ABQ1X0P7_9BACT|nr:hypothetical protein GCM10011378_28060 [Hymenobacter glacieicola]